MGDNMIGPQTEQGEGNQNQPSTSDINSIGAANDITDCGKEKQDGPATSQGQQKQKKKTITEELASRITVAGVEDAYKAKTKKERYAYICAIILFLYAMIHSSVLISLRYIDEGSIQVNQSHVFGRVAPFPNISVCLPSMWDKNAPDSLTFPNSVLRQMERVGVTKEDVADFLAQHPATFSYSRTAEKEVLQIIAGKVIDASMDVNPRILIDLMEQPCTQLLSNCAFDGQPFDCCSAVEIMMADISCLHISTGRIKQFANSPHVIGGKSTDPSRLAFSGLSFDVTIDPNLVVFDDDVASDGLVIHVDTLPSAFSSPTTIPFGADALIQLSPPKKIKEISNCVAPPEKLPKLKDFSYYDPHAIFCLTTQFYELILTHPGCSGIPVLTFIPNNSTRCSGNTLFLIKQLITGDIPPMPKDLERRFNEVYTVSATKRSMSVFQTFILIFAFQRDTMRQLYYGDNCPVHCSRWSYPILSTSYGYIYQQDHQPINSSLSRVRVFFPEASYRLHTEESFNMFYLAFCEMGGVWGVYLGFSMVSLVQVFAYGVILFWKKKIKKKKDMKRSNAVRMKIIRRI